MADLKVEDLELTDDQKSGAAPLSEEQEVKIQETVDFEPRIEGEEPKKEPEKKAEEPKKEPEKEETKPEDLTPEQKEEQETENQRIIDKAEELKITPEKVIEIETQEKADKETAEATKKQEEEAETERLTKKAEELGKTVEEVKEAENQESEETEQKRIEAIAKEENISVEQVKEMEKADNEIVERHQGDPMKLARAVRTQQKAHAKLENEHEALKTSVEKQERIINEEEFNAQCEDKRETIITEYRAKYSEESEEKEDDVVFEKGKALLKTKWDDAITSEKKAVSDGAKDKRTELLDGLSDDVKKEFSSDVEELLGQLTDQQVLNKKFNVDYIIQLARGKKYTPEYIKKVEDDSYKRGKENRKIVRTITGPKSPPPSSKKGTVTTTLNEDQKQRARDMYEGTNMTEQQMYDEFEKIKDNDF